MQALPIFLDRLANPVAAVLISITVVLIFGELPLVSTYMLRVYYTCDQPLALAWKNLLN